MLDAMLLILLTLLALLGWSANLLGMPGNWLIVLMAVLGLWLSPPENSSHVAWAPFLMILAVASLGEVLEFAASALGASRMGGSRRGTALAIGGSLMGAIVGFFAGTLIPIPLLGNLIGSLLLGAAGAFGGAVAGERWVGKDWDQSLQIGSAAFWGRLLGTVAKAVCGTVALGIYLISIWW